MSMKTPIIAVLFTALAALLLSACDGTDASGTDADTVTLRVERQEWTGWSRKQPDPSTSKVHAAEGESFDLDGLGDTITFTVTEIDDGQVSVKSSSALDRRSGDDSGIDLTTDDTEFEFSDSSPLEVSTPTMDGGVTFTLQVV